MKVILMKTNPIRYSSAVGEVWVMATFKIKYSHKIFDIQAVRELANVLLNEAFDFYKIRCKKLAFDSDHVHMILDMGLYSKPELAKRIKGYVARNIFHMMPWLKKSRFWGSGLWNPAYDIRGVNDINIYLRYLDKQKYADNGQKTLISF
ncbi:MAG TPA: hypothetical protein DCE80_20605 [Ignavibacteriales bacterium]|nr:hypothetical protein [Ignavibacteriales bacterium]